jgi:fibronectin type 3 domain-containing protein
LSADAIADESGPGIGNAALSWDPNGEGDLAGYRVYFGASSRNYGAPIAVGLGTTYTVSALPPGATYYFAVTAYNSRGYESLMSNEVSKTIQ